MPTIPYCAYTSISCHTVPTIPYYAYYVIPQYGHSMPTIPYYAILFHTMPILYAYYACLVQPQLNSHYRKRGNLRKVHETKQKRDKAEE